MERYWLFSNKTHYASGGMADFIGDFSDFEVAKLKAIELIGNEEYPDDWAHIFDTKLKKVTLCIGNTSMQGAWENDLEPKKLYRPQRGSLVDAMAEVVVVYSRMEVVHLVEKSFSMFDKAYVEAEVGPINLETVEINSYGYDPRIGWDTYVVTLNGRAVGFTNCYLEK